MNEIIKNRVLLRQLKKCNINDFSSLTSEDFKRLLVLVEQNYEDMDNNIYRLERALEISNIELSELNNTLEIKVEEEVKKNREKDKKLLVQSRLASMGEMIGNIAHQWRQPLSVISTISSGIKLQMESQEVSKKRVSESFEKILECTEFLDQTIEDFREFFVRNKEKEIFDIVKYVEKTISIINISFNNFNISLINNKCDFECKSYSYPNELIQVFLNILNNSKDVLVEKNISKKLVFIEYSFNQNYNIVSIFDNGGGISKSIINKIFDPYFTTKHSSLGTGIGLFMSKQIVEKHSNGKLEVENIEFVYEDKKYKGACFKIFLPKYQ